jgi:enoyl-CoA hydratase
MTGTTKDTRLHVTRDDGVVEVTMDFPPVNAFSRDFLQAIDDTVRSVGDDTRAVIIASAVDGIFAAGGDIQFMAYGALDDQLEYVALCQRTYSAFEELSCPSIAAIDGACLGGGVELSLGCDLRVVAESSKLGLPEVALGILPGAGGTQRLGRAIGGSRARDLMLTGRRISGREAAEIGLANRLVADGDALATAHELARGFADGATPAIAAIKRLTVAAPDHPLEEGLAMERETWKSVRQSPHAQEGLSAFAERRRPDFRSLRA